MVEQDNTQMIKTDQAAAEPTTQADKVQSNQNPADPNAAQKQSKELKTDRSLFHLKELLGLVIQTEDQ